jgi:hypothetical protein
MTFRFPESRRPRATVPGRVCEITNGRFVEAKQEKRWLAVRLLRSNPAGGFGSGRASRSAELAASNLTSKLMMPVS